MMATYEEGQEVMVKVPSTSATPLWLRAKIVADKENDDTQLMAEFADGHREMTDISNIELAH